MREQNRQVNRAEPRRIQKSRRALMQNDGEISVIRQIANQKNNRGAECGNHAVAVRDDFFLADENKSCREKNRAQAVERGVDGGQIVDAHGSRSSRRIVASSFGWTAFVQSTPSPPVSKMPRSCACL